MKYNNVFVCKIENKFILSIINGAAISITDEDLFKPSMTGFKDCRAIFLN